MALEFETILNASNVVGFYTAKVRDIAKHPLLSIFPPKKSIDTSLTTIKGANNAPVVMRPSAPDALPPIRTRGTAETITLKIPSFREELPFKEEDIRKLALYRATDNPYLKQAINDIYNDQASLIDGATATRLRMIGQALSTGAISIAASNGITVSASYGFDASTQRTTLSNTDLWSATSTATPIADLLAAKKKTKLAQVACYMNQATFTEMIATDEVKNTLYPSGYSGLVLEGNVKAWLKDQGINVLIVDGVINQNSYAESLGGTEYGYYPDGYVTIAPVSTLGNMWFAPTTEELALVAGAGDVKDIQIVDTGVAIVSTSNYNGVVKLSNYVAQYCLPSFEAIGKIQIIIV